MLFKQFVSDLDLKGSNKTTKLKITLFKLSNVTAPLLKFSIKLKRFKASDCVNINEQVPRTRRADWTDLHLESATAKAFSAGDKW